MLNLLTIEHAENNVLCAIGCILERTVAAGDANPAPLYGRQFVGSHSPDICVHDYLKRLKHYFKCDSACWVAMLVYLDRVLSVSKAKGVPVVLDHLNVHRLVIGSALLAVKFHEDTQYKNEYYAHVGGISLQEINRIELLFCNLLGWDFNIDVATFEKYFQQLRLHPKVCVSCQDILSPVTDKTSTSVSPKKTNVFSEISTDCLQHKSKHTRVHSSNNCLMNCLRDLHFEMNTSEKALPMDKENFQHGHHNTAVAC